MVFRYLYYRKAYYEKNDNPVFRTFMYLSLLFASIGGVILIYIERILELIKLADDPIFMKSPIFWIVFYGGILLYTYLCYSRKSLRYYEELFSDRNWLNENIKIWMLIVLPFIMFLGGIYISVILFGGEIFGNEIIGVLH